MLYSIVGVDYHKIRAVSTRTFENIPLSAECKKMLSKLWQKERGRDGASPLDKRLFTRQLVRVTLKMNHSGSGFYCGFMQKHCIC